MLIRTATSSDLDAWVELRTRLWAGASVDKHRDDVAAILAMPTDRSIAFVAVDQAGSTCAFAEAALRHDYVNGCETSPVAFLEGIYVRPENRGSGIGMRLSKAVEDWARERGCEEMASDASLQNTDSHAFHAAIGFEETERVVYFRKPL